MPATVFFSCRLKGPTTKEFRVEQTDMPAFQGGQIRRLDLEVQRRPLLKLLSEPIREDDRKPRNA